MNVPIKRRGGQARNQPSRRVDVPPLPDDEHRPFEDLVADALDALPEQFARLLENVAIVIEDEPRPDQLRETGMLPGQSLYGLYEGVSPVVYGADLVPFPNKITLFRMTLEEDFPHPADLEREVQRTVIHELAHHAGIGDDELHRWGF
jgi:predicted Zn-dependent protease with MMP-like domain